MGLESMLKPSNSVACPFKDPDSYDISRMEKARASGGKFPVLLEGLYWFIPIAGDVQAHIFFKNKRDKSPTLEERSILAVREAIVIGGKYIAEASIAAGIYLL